MDGRNASTAVRIYGKISLRFIKSAEKSQIWHGDYFDHWYLKKKSIFGYFWRNNSTDVLRLTLPIEYTDFMRNTMLFRRKLSRFLSWMNCWLV